MTASAQCTNATINWDWQYRVGNFSSPARFAIGTNAASISWGTNVTSPTTPVNSTYTGYGNGYGNGHLVQYNVSNGTITITFDEEVRNARFSIYDLDNRQGVTITAHNAANVAQQVSARRSTLSTNSTENTNSVRLSSGTTSPAATNSTISGTSIRAWYGSSATAAGDLEDNATTSGVNIDITGPVKTITLAFARYSTSSNNTLNNNTDAIWISDISACVTENFPTNYHAASAPEPGQPGYILATDGTNSVFAVNTATAAATRLFTDPNIAASTGLNSLAYDPYNQIIYYASGEGVTTNKTIYKYNIKTCTRSVLISDVTVSPYNIPINSQGVGGSAAAFYNGSLYFGIDAGVSATEDISIWRIDINESGNATSASRVFGVQANNGSTSLHNWGDFVIHDGMLYHFNSALVPATNTRLMHYNLNNQTITAQFNVTTNQTAIGHDGTIYNVSDGIAVYNKAGGIGAKTAISGGGWAAGAIATDAAEAFKFPADFGDAPASFGRPFHQQVSCAASTGLLQLGTTIDYEVEPAPGTTATGDNTTNYSGSGTTNDEDGISTFPVLTLTSTGTTDSYTVTVAVRNTTGSAKTLHGWIDFNGDGQFAANEYASVSVANNATTVNITWAGRAAGVARAGLTYTRFRITSTTLSDVTGTTAVDERSTAAALDGEVEDYAIKIGLTISGNVFNDINGMTDNLVNGTGTGTAGTQLYAYLAANGVIENKVTVAINGVYSFSNANANTNYTVTISTANLAVGAAAPAASVLPSGWVHTGASLAGTNLGNATGQVTGGTTTASYANLNFGIERLPVASSVTLASQLNPGDNKSVTIAASSFTGTDFDGGSVTKIRYSSFPTNSTSITIGGTTFTSANWPAAGVTVAAGTSVSIIPQAGAVTPVISFKAIDNADQESLNTATVTVPLTVLRITGTVFNDANGQTDNVVNGTGIGTASNSQLYTYLAKDGVIADRAAVASNGMYAFTTVYPTNTYTVTLSSAMLAIGSPAPAASALPSGWVNTGAALGTINLSTNGQVTGTIGTSNFIGLNFGLQQPPISNSATYTLSQPQYNTYLSLTADNKAGALAGSDLEDGSLSAGKTLEIVSLQNMEGNELYYGETLLTEGTRIENYNPELLRIRFIAPPSTSSTFTYSFIDAAGMTSATPGSYTLQWAYALPVSLMSFSAKLQDQEVALTWITASEQDNDYFVVERSLDGKFFTEIGKVKGAGTSSQRLTYNFSDTKAPAGELYYRLKQVDFDGTFAHSKVVAIKTKGFAAAAQLQAYPNPFKDQLSVTYDSQVAGKATLQLIDLQGKVILSQVVEHSSGSNTWELTGNMLQAGVYIIRIKGDTIDQKLKVVKAL
ncbi:GEVED domain-containing protein [Pontibacter qinzhouensis]|nr:GEVED domain-containing protein [Pontibacter qinzhouensis]